MSDRDPSIQRRAKSWLLFLLRWGVAVAGIWYVVVNISWRDTALVLDERNRPVEMRLAEPADPTHANVLVLDPVTNEVQRVDRDRLVNEPDREQVLIRWGIEQRMVPLLAADLSNDVRNPSVERLLVANPESPDPATAEGVWIDPDQVVGNYELRIPYPVIQAGLRHMLHGADPLYIWAAIGIFPLTFLITGVRWHLLLKALEINIGLARAFVLNMVGAFYNTFMPGSTGGDVIKAWYAAKSAPTKRTRAVMSVLVDRAIGLIALVILGGTMAALQWEIPACRQVALASATLLGLLWIGLVVFYTPALRRWTGMDFILRRLPMQRQVSKAVETMEMYRRRPWLVLATLIMTFPVHITVIVSAMLAGLAFDLPLSPWYYWVVVPVVVLSGAIPISPQGAGVMEFFAILLTKPEGATVAQAFTLTMAIRLVQILWNLTGGLFVLRGGYQAPTEKEQESMDEDAATESSSSTPVQV